MFSSDSLEALARQHQPFLKQLRAIADTLDQRFEGLRPTIEALLLAVASGEPLLLVGPPGTAKSRLIRSLCELAEITRKDGSHQDDVYFEYLLTPFTEPGELFGFYDIARAKEGQGLVRLEKYTLQRARVVYLDEFFNGSSAILNSLLAIMNERRFHDRGEIRQVNLECLFAATNRIPETPELRAVYDRFLMRAHVDNIPASVERVSSLLRRGWMDTYHEVAVPPGVAGELFARAKAFRAQLNQLAPQLEAAPAFLRALTNAIQMARDYGLSDMSNRRVLKMVRLMAIHALYQSAGDAKGARKPLALGRAQLCLIPDLFLDRQDDEVMRKLEDCCRDASLP